MKGKKTSGVEVVNSNVIYIYFLMDKTSHPAQSDLSLLQEKVQE